MSHECKWKRAFVDNSLLILIEGNQNGGTCCSFLQVSVHVASYSIMFSTSPSHSHPHPTPTVTFLLRGSGLLQLGLIKTKITVCQWPCRGFFSFGHRIVRDNPSALMERTLNICKKWYVLSERRYSCAKLRKFRSLRSCFFVSFEQITFKLCNSTNLKAFFFFFFFFLAELADFS